MNQGDKDYWAEKVNGPEKPEVPQEPDVAFTVTCKNCHHTLDRHSLDRMEFVVHPVTGHEALGWGWDCHTMLTPGDQRILRKCECRVFRPSEQYTREFKQEPLL